MKRSMQLVAALACASLIAPAAHAATTTTITLLPTYAGNTNIAGNAGTSAPGFATGSWQAPGSGAKQESYIAASALFAESVTLNDIASISYWTNKPGTAAAVDWTFIMYTAATGTGDEAPWYHTRLNSEPYFTQTPAVASNTWHAWSTNDPTNPMLFYDQGRSGNYGTYTDPTLATLQAGPVTWANSTTYDYRTSSDVVSLFSLQTGSAWNTGFTGLVDGLTVTLKNGDVGIVNLEAVPLPAAVWGGMMLLGALGGAKGLRRLRRTA